MMALNRVNRFARRIAQTLRLLRVVTSPDIGPSLQPGRPAGQGRRSLMNAGDRRDAGRDGGGVR